MPDTLPTTNHTSTATDPTAPDIGDTFTREDATYIVIGWLKPAEFDPLPDDLVPLFTDTPPSRPTLVFCDRTDATHVAAYSSTGHAIPITDVTITGHANWHDAHLDHARRRATRLIGSYVYTY